MSSSITITGDSNDTNLVLESASGSIQDNGSGATGPAGPAGPAASKKLSQQQQNLVKNLLPLGNSQSVEETLSNVITDALRDLTDVDTVVIKATNFKNGLDKSLPSSYVSKEQLVKTKITLEQLKTLLENSHLNSKLYKISGVSTEFNVENNTLQHLYLRNNLVYTNVSQDVHYKSLSSETTGYLKDKATVVSVILDNTTALSLNLTSDNLTIDLEDVLEIALTNLLLKLENSSSQGALLNKKYLPEMINGRQRKIGYGGSAPVGAPWLRTTEESPCVKGKDGACSGVGIGSHTGANIISRGGNAADATVAMAFANSINGSAFGFFGGAGFITIYDRVTNTSSCIDCREALSQDVSAGAPWPGTGAFSTMTIGVPGFMSGLYKLFKDNGSGKFTFAELVQPAIDILEINQDLSPSLFATFYPKGFEKDGVLIDTSKYANTLFTEDASGILQPDLKNMHHPQPEKLKFLKNVQKYGPNYVYYGKEKLGIAENTFADEFVNTIQKQLVLGHQGDESAIASSVVKLADMEMYEAKSRNPTKTTFILNGSNYELITHPAPCAAHCGSFGVKLAFASSAIVNNDMRHPGTCYRVAMVLHLAYKMRSYIAGDYDNWINTPVLQNFADDMSNNFGLTFDTSSITSNDDFYNMLVSDVTIGLFVTYLQSQPDWVSAASLDNPVIADLSYSSPPQQELGATNNFCVASNTMVVQFNNSINYLNGAKCSAMGIPLNNEVYDFPDIGTRGINDHGPSRRPASSQSPYILLKDGKPVYTIGGSGGWRIYIQCAFKLICYLSGLSAEKVQHVPVMMSSFNRLAFTNEIPTAVKDIVTANNTNGFFVGAFTTGAALCQSIEINEENYTAVVAENHRVRGCWSAAVAKLV